MQLLARRAELEAELPKLLVHLLGHSLLEAGKDSPRPHVLPDLPRPLSSRSQSQDWNQDLGGLGVRGIGSGSLASECNAGPSLIRK